MKAVVAYGIDDIRVEERPEPTAGSGELVVKTKVAGLYSQDLHLLNAEQVLPLILGQDLAGEISTIGTGVHGFELGAPVAIHSADLLGQKIDGAYAEYVRIPAELVKAGAVVSLDEEISLEDAVLTEPLARTFAAARIDRMQEGQHVLIIGCGSVGLMHLKTAKWSGCKVMATDINPTRLALAGQMGANHLLKLDTLQEDVLRYTDGKGAKTVIISVPMQDVLADYIKLTAQGGSCNLCSLEATEQAKSIAVAQNITLTSTCSPSVVDFRKCLQLIKEEAIIVSDMISHRFTLETFPEAIEKIKKQELIRGVITFGEMLSLAF